MDSKRHEQLTVVRRVRLDADADKSIKFSQRFPSSPLGPHPTMALRRVYHWPNLEHNLGPSQRHKLSVSNPLGVSMACWPSSPLETRSIQISNLYIRHSRSDFLPDFYSIMPPKNKRARESSPSSEAPHQRTKLSAFDERYDTATKSNEDVLSKSRLIYFHILIH